jgi:hypothetical protein
LGLLARIKIYQLTLSALFGSQDHLALLAFFLVHHFIKGNGTLKHCSACEPSGAGDLIKVIGQPLVETHLKTRVTHGAILRHG